MGCRRRSAAVTGRCGCCQEEVGDAVSTVFSILKGNSLKPNTCKIFKVSCYPGFELKVRDFVGLYVNPTTLSFSRWAGRHRYRRLNGRRNPCKRSQPSTGPHPTLKHNGTTCLPDGGPRCRNRQGPLPDGRVSPLGGNLRPLRPCGREDGARNPSSCHSR